MSLQMCWLHFDFTHMFSVTYISDISNMKSVCTFEFQGGGAKVVKKRESA